MSSVGINTNLIQCNTVSEQGDNGDKKKVADCYTMQKPIQFTHGPFSGIWCKHIWNKLRTATGKCVVLLLLRYKPQQLPSNKSTSPFGVLLSLCTVDLVALLTDMHLTILNSLDTRNCHHPICCDLTECVLETFNQRLTYYICMILQK